MPLPLPWLPRVLPYVEWLALSLQHAALGYRISILEDHPNALPRCYIYRSQVPLGRLKNCHYVLEECKQGGERNLRYETLLA